MSLITSQAMLKPGWTKVKFGEVVRLCKEKSANPEADGIERYVGLEHIEPEDLRIRRWGLVAEGTTFTSRFKPGQVLFGKRRAYQRKVAVADFEGVCSGDIYVFESANPKHLLPELLPFICQTEQFFNYAVETSMGSLSPRTNWKHLEKFEFHLPSIDEQRRVYTRLIYLEKSIFAYKRAQESAKVGRESLSIFLFNEDHRNKLKKLHEIILDSRYGPRFSGSLYDDNGSIGQIRTTDMDDEGNINYSLVPKVNLQVQNYQDHFLQNGDVVISRSGTCGITSVFIPQSYPIIPGAFLIRLRPSKKVSSNYLHEYFSSPLGRQLTSSLARGGVQKNISGSELLGQKIPCPSHERQKAVVAKIKDLRDAERRLVIRIIFLENMKKLLLDSVAREIS